MTDEFAVQMSLPLDDDGFLRRECPTCEREFKRLYVEQDDEAEPATDGVYCPYCGVRAPANAWWTQAQLTAAYALMYRDVVAPELEELRRTADGVRRNSGGLFSVEVSYDEPSEPPTLTERSDMRRIDFVCHPAEPVKVADDWAEDIHCLICGSRSAS
jgi:DNA-directed RNA polymerase subunit RPC12/RpoP